MSGLLHAGDAPGPDPGGDPGGLSGAVRTVIMPGAGATASMHEDTFPAAGLADTDTSRANEESGKNFTADI